MKIKNQKAKIKNQKLYCCGRGVIASGIRNGRSQVLIFDF
jgi:hypothetical protein